MSGGGPPLEQNAAAEATAYNAADEKMALVMEINAAAKAAIAGRLNEDGTKRIDWEGEDFDEDKAVAKLLENKDNHKLLDTKLDNLPPGSPPLKYSSKLQLKFLHLENVNLEDATLSDSNLEGANLQNSKLTRADFLRANLKGAKLAYAEMPAANLGRAILKGANFHGANLSSALFHVAEIHPDADFSDAQGCQFIQGFEYVNLDFLGCTPPKFLDTSAAGSGGILSFLCSVVGSVCADANAAAEDAATEAAEDAGLVSEGTLGLMKKLTGTARSPAKAAKVETPVKFKDPAQVQAFKVAFEQAKDNRDQSAALRKQLLAR